MTLAADEFIRRFLLHVLPHGFHRIRHYGYLANGGRAAKLAYCRHLLTVPEPAPPAPAADYRERYQQLTGSFTRCLATIGLITPRRCALSRLCVPSSCAPPSSSSGESAANSVWTRERHSFAGGSRLAPSERGRIRPNETRRQSRPGSSSAVFKEHGALKLVECWGDDVPEGPDKLVLLELWKDQAALDAHWITR